MFKCATMKYYSLCFSLYISCLFTLKVSVVLESTIEPAPACSFCLQSRWFAVTPLCLWSSTHVLISQVVCDLHAGLMRHSNCTGAEVQTSLLKTNSIHQPNSSKRNKMRQRRPPCVPLKEALNKALPFVWALPLRPVCILASHKPKPLLYRVILIGTLYSFHAFFPP